MPLNSLSPRSTAPVQASTDRACRKAVLGHPASASSRLAPAQGSPTRSYRPGAHTSAALLQGICRRLVCSFKPANRGQARAGLAQTHRRLRTTRGGDPPSSSRTTTYPQTPQLRFPWGHRSSMASRPRLSHLLPGCRSEPRSTRVSGRASHPKGRCCMCDILLVHGAMGFSFWLSKSGRGICSIFLLLGGSLAGWVFTYWNGEASGFGSCWHIPYSRSSSLLLRGRLCRLSAGFFLAGSVSGFPLALRFLVVSIRTKLCCFLWWAVLMIYGSGRVWRGVWVVVGAVCML